MCVLKGKTNGPYLSASCRGFWVRRGAENRATMTMIMRKSHEAYLFILFLEEDGSEGDG